MKTFLRQNRLILLVIAASLLLLLAGILLLRGSSRTDVVIDPGHGGKDYGADAGGRYEKNDNLLLAKAVAKQLKNRGINVTLTREKDRFISLKKRCVIANRKHALLFVSLHRNSAESASASGTEIWIGSENGSQSRALAEGILAGLETAGISNCRGVKVGYVSDPQKDYFVNKNTEMPSCLVELGFITSEEDNALLDRNLETYARAIADAIAAQPALQQAKDQ